MDQQFDFRALLIKLQDCLSDNDRRRLHFIVGDTIPRHLRDDPTLGGTLSLLESLFDQAKISEQDFDYLIHAFNEIHCYAAVKRLKEHQLAQYQRNRNETIPVNVSDLFDDNEDDKTNSNNTRDSTASQSTTISFDQQNLQKNKSSNQSENKGLKILVKQICHSRLTICQLLLFILNIVAILIIVLLLVFLTKPKSSISEILLIKIGSMNGNPGGGNAFNDAQDCSLTFDDKIVNINAGWTSDTLDYVMFVYSNGNSIQHGRETYRYSPYKSEFYVDSNENINGVTIYTDTRLIINPFAVNGSYIVVGLRFYTDEGRSSDLFGSSNGTQVNEVFPNFTINYARGRSLAYVDAIQFIWYRQMPPSSIATLSMY